MNHYFKIYKSFDQAKLVSIIKESYKYEQNMIDAAVQELKARGIPIDEIKSISLPTVGLIGSKDVKTVKINKQSKQKTDVLFETIDVIIPNVHMDENENKRKYLFYVVSVMILFLLYQSSPTYYKLMTKGFDVGDGPMLGSICMDFFYVSGLFLFWSKMRTGWIVVTSIVAFDLMITIYNWVHSIAYYQDQLILAFNYNYFTSFVLQSGIIWILFRPFIIKVYSLKQKHFVTMAVIAAILYLIYIFFLD